MPSEGLSDPPPGVTASGCAAHEWLDPVGSSHAVTSADGLNGAGATPEPYALTPSQMGGTGVKSPHSPSGWSLHHRT